MVKYEDLMILPHHNQYRDIYCAMCGNRIYWVEHENKTYNYCRKCKAIKTIFSINDISLLPPTPIKFKFWSNEDD